MANQALLSFMEHIEHLYSVSFHTTTISIIFYSVKCLSSRVDNIPKEIDSKQKNVRSHVPHFSSGTEFTRNFMEIISVEKLMNLSETA